MMTRVFEWIERRSKGEQTMLYTTLINRLDVAKTEPRNGIIVNNFANEYNVGKDLVGITGGNK